MNIYEILEKGETSKLEFKEGEKENNIVLL